MNASTNENKRSHTPTLLPRYRLGPDCMQFPRFGIPVLQGFHDDVILSPQGVVFGRHSGSESVEIAEIVEIWRSGAGEYGILAGQCGARVDR